MNEKSSQPTTRHPQIFTANMKKKSLTEQCGQCNKLINHFPAGNQLESNRDLYGPSLRNPAALTPILIIT